MGVMVYSGNAIGIGDFDNFNDLMRVLTRGARQDTPPNRTERIATYLVQRTNEHDSYFVTYTPGRTSVRFEGERAEGRQVPETVIEVIGGERAVERFRTIIGEKQKMFEEMTGLGRRRLETTTSS